LYEDLSQANTITVKELLQTYYKTSEKQNEEITEKRRKRYNKRRKNDPLFRLIINMRTQLNIILKEKNINKKNKTLDIIGCTPRELKMFLEKKFKPGMNWNNHGVYGWHVDHVIPLSLAKTTDEVEYLMNHKNLQPLWAKENIKKSDQSNIQNISNHISEQFLN